jgi:hypothetical protein
MQWPVVNSSFGILFDMSVSLLDRQAQQQALLQAATLAAAASQPPAHVSSGRLGHATSGLLPHTMSAGPHMRKHTYGLDSFTAAASAATTAAVTAAFAAGFPSEPASGGAGSNGASHEGGGSARNRRQGSSDAESEQACAPFAHVESGSPRSKVPAVRLAGVGGGSLGAGKPSSLKGGSGGRRIDITVDATPLVSSTAGCTHVCLCYKRKSRLRTCGAHHVKTCTI